MIITIQIYFFHQAQKNFDFQANHFQSLSLSKVKIYENVLYKRNTATG